MSVESLCLIINMGSCLLLDQSLSGFQSHCQSALCLWWIDVFWRRWLLTVRCSSVVSSWDRSGVWGFCCGVWGGDLTVGLHREVLHGVCGLLHCFTFLWNTEVIIVRSDCAFILNVIKAFDLYKEAFIKLLKKQKTKSISIYPSIYISLSLSGFTIIPIDFYGSLFSI